MMARSALLEFGGEASRTLIKDGIIMGETWNAVDMLVSMKKVAIAWMAEALMPQKAFSANVKFVETKLLYRRHGIWFMESKNGVDVGSIWINGSREGRRRDPSSLIREDQWCCIAEAATEDTVDGDTFRAPKGVVRSEGESTRVVVGIQSGSRGVGY
jgi:hypothetical protein